MDEQRRPIVATARELYGRVVYSHKTHEKEREIWSEKVCRMNRYNIWLAGATTFFAIISATLQPVWAIYLTAVFAVLTICFVMWQSNFDPAGKEAQHRAAAKELLWIREQLLLLITECHIPDSTQKHLERCLEVITRELTAVYKFAPNTSPEAYAAAEAMIKTGHFTFSDDEIDDMLPTDLRKKKLGSDQEGS
jgi:SMODS and SLOG-associating 2TM effector domain family 4